MNDWDKHNLEFILSRSATELTTWFEAVKEFGDEDEITYALEMLQAARNHVELELLSIFDSDAEKDLSIATAYLQRFRLNHE